jgi:hypothetical protein
MFGENPAAVSLNIEAYYASTVANSSDGEQWGADWSNMQETAMNGCFALDKSSTDELSNQAVLLSGFYVFKRPYSTSWQHSFPQKKVSVKMSHDSTTLYPLSDGSWDAASSGASTSSGFTGHSGGAQDTPEPMDGAIVSTDVEEVRSNLFAHYFALHILEFTVLQPSLGDCKLHFCGGYFPRCFQYVQTQLCFIQTQQKARFVLTSDHDLITLADVRIWRTSVRNQNSHSFGRSFAMRAFLAIIDGLCRKHLASMNSRYKRMWLVAKVSRAFHIRNWVPDWLCDT